MAGPRLSMHKAREILRQKWGQGRSHREVARSQGVSVGMVCWRSRENVEKWTLRR